MSRLAVDMMAGGIDWEESTAVLDKVSCLANLEMIPLQFKLLHD